MSIRLTVFLCGLLALYLGTVYLGLSFPLDTDFTKFYASPIQFQEGGSLFAGLDPARFALRGADYDDGIEIHPNLNTPLLSLLLWPLTWLPWSLAYVLFTLASLACGFRAMLLLWEELGFPKGLNSRITALILLLLFYPTWANVRYGQISLFLFLLLVMLWRYARRGREIRASVILGLLLGIKLFTALFILFFLLKRRFKLLFFASLTFALTWISSLFTFGIQVLSEYRQALSEVTWTGAGWNASFQGFFSRLFGGSEGTPWWDAPQLGRICATLLAVLATLLLIEVLRRPFPEKESGDDLGFALVFPVMLLLSPLGWMYYFPILLLPAGILWQRGVRWGAGGFLFLATLPLPFREAASIDGPLDWFILGGAYFYALCWLSGALVWEAWGEVKRGRGKSLD